MTLIKICGVRSVEEAKMCAAAGADFVGIVFHRLSRRFVASREEREALCRAIACEGAKAVAVFFEEDGPTICREVEGLEVAYIQSYRDVALPAEYGLIYGCRTAERVLREDDFSLVDGAHPGSGEPFDPLAAAERERSRLFLAGGIDSGNVVDVIESYRPAGVDLSSGVERGGVKDRKMIEDFIRKVRRHEERVR